MQRVLESHGVCRDAMPLPALLVRAAPGLPLHTAAHGVAEENQHPHRLSSHPGPAAPPGPRTSATSTMHTTTMRTPPTWCRCRRAPSPSGGEAMRCALVV